ncbi:MAG: hypothetical protein KGM16_05430 [Bacteroidota bacterium]|nr:hypothetical protein [Bacteroidota bacterium]
MEKIKGKFFFPLNRNKKKKQVPGIIEISDNGFVKLELLGVLIEDENHPFPFSELKRKVNIWGIAENGSKISLLQCDAINITQHFDKMGMTFETYHARFILKNDWVENASKKYFRKLSVSIEGLGDWLNISGGIQNTIFENGGEKYSYNYKEPSDIFFEIEKHLKGCFYFRIKKPELRFGYHIEQKSCLEFSSDKSESLLFFLERLYHFQRFLNLVSDSVLDIDFITMTSYHNSYQVGQQKYFTELNLVYLKENLQNQGNISNRLSFLIHYKDLENNFEGIIQQWFKFRTGGMSRVIEIIYEGIKNKQKVRNYLFIAVSQAAEGFYRIEKQQRHSKFEKAINALLQDNLLNIHFSSFEKPKDIEKLVQTIKEYRNDLTHIGKFKNLEPQQSEIYFLTNLLKNITTLALLKKTGISNDSIRITF